MHSRQALGRALALAALISWCTHASARAGEWEHLGSAPPGTELLQIESRAEASPIQLMGTIDPPTVLVNGKTVALAAADPGETPGSDRQALWVNGVRVEAHGTAGRFFTTLAANIVASGELRIVLRTSRGKVLAATVGTRKTFLESSFVLQRSVPLKEKKGAEYPIVISGALPRHAKLRVRHGRVTREGERVEIHLRVPLGESVIAATLGQPNGARRVINVPIQVSRLVSKSPHILSLEAQNEQRIGQPWKIPASGAALHGMTNARARLTVDGDHVPVGSDGEFLARIEPQGKAWNEIFDVDLPGAGPREFRKAFIAPDYVEPRWYAPRFRRKRETYLRASALAATWVTPRLAGSNGELRRIALSARSHPVGPVIGVAVGRYLRFDQSIELGWEHSFSLTDDRDRRTLSLPSSDRISLAYEYQPVPILGVGAALSYFRTRAESEGLLAPIDGSSSSLDLAVIGDLRIYIARKWEIVPRLLFSPAPLSWRLGGSAVRWQAFSIEPLALRMYL